MRAAVLFSCLLSCLLLSACADFLNSGAADVLAGGLARTADPEAGQRRCVYERVGDRVYERCR